MPLEVEHGVNRLDLDPPIALLHRLSYQLRVVTWSHDEFVAILYICILKRNLGLLFVGFYRISIQVSILLGEWLLLSHGLLEAINELRQTQRVDELVSGQHDLFKVAVRRVILNNCSYYLGLLI